MDRLLNLKEDLAILILQCDLDRLLGIELRRSGTVRHDNVKDRQRARESLDVDLVEDARC
ncbi:MAG: hypothetical protein WEB52_10585 [Dehalococcoidia bacterium]